MKNWKIKMRITYLLISSSQSSTLKYSFFASSIKEVIICNYFMGVKENKNSDKPSKRAGPPSQSDDSDESNDTMPVGAIQNLCLNDRANSNETVAAEQLSHPIGKAKQIKKREKRNKDDCKEKMRAKIQSLNRRVQELQEKLRLVRQQEDSCPHCHFYRSQNIKRQGLTPDDALMLDCYKRSVSSRDSLEFEKMDFTTPLMYSAEMQQRSWVFLGTVLIAMGSKVMDMDGTVNVFKVLKESVDNIRRQVQKSEQRLSMDFFLGKQGMGGEGGMQEFGFDPFYRPQEQRGGLQLQGVRVQSVQQYELCFDQKLTFNVKYDALITVMEYMKQNCTIAFA